MSAAHDHPCQHCGVPVRCIGALEQNHDGMPEVICSTYHRPGGALATIWCERCELLIDLADYFDDRQDITNDGGPNAAMTFHRRLMEVLGLPVERHLEARLRSIEAHCICGAALKGRTK